MTYEEAIAFWYSRIDYERRMPQPGDLKLDRMRLLLRQLGDPHQRMRIIHITGTKGKGSTSAMLAAVLQAAGYRVGLFTSPHLRHVEERIQVNQQPISHRELAMRIAEIAPHVRAMESSGDLQSAPTFFEVGTVLGFLHFLCRGVEIAVIEVGLGGRFDSTNVVDPIVSVITSVSLDHMQQLGNTLGQIAFEKAGIIKPQRPVISGTEGDEPCDVIQNIARSRNSPLYRIHNDFHVEYQLTHHADGRPIPYVQVQTHRRHWPKFELNLLGRHQANNAAVAISTIERLQEHGLTIPDAAIARGLATVQWPARMEMVQRDPWLIIDCAHNVASAEALVDTLRECFPDVRKRWLVFAVSTDKDVAGIIRVLGSYFHTFMLTTYRNSRTTPLETLQALTAELAPQAEVLLQADTERALQEVRSHAGTDDLIVITGSVFLAGELRQ